MKIRLLKQDGDWNKGDIVDAEIGVTFNTIRGGHVELYYTDANELKEDFEILEDK